MGKRQPPAFILNLKMSGKVKVWYFGGDTLVSSVFTNTVHPIQRGLDYVVVTD